MNEGDTQFSLGELLGVLAGAATYLFTAESLLRFIRQQGNAEIPNELLPDNALMDALRRGLVDNGTVVDELSKAGYDDNKTQTLIALATSLIASGDLVTLLYRGSITRDDFNTRMRHLGFTGESATLLASVFEQRLQPSDVITAEWRGISKPGSSEDAAKDLADIGYTKERIELLRKIALRLPNLNDLYQFSAWSVDDDAFAAAFGLDDKRPANFLEDAEKVGVPADYAKKAWRSHWQVPSLFIIKALEQSGALSDADVSKMLTALQIPPYFVDVLVKGLKKNLTEAQIQSLYDSGTITEADLPGYLANAGYSAKAIPSVVSLMHAAATSPAAARKKAQMAAAPGLYDITVGNVLEAFKDGIIGEESAQKYLDDLGEPPTAAWLKLSIAKYQLAKSQLRDHITATQESYLAGAIDAQEVIAELSQLGITAGAQQHYLRLWDKKNKSTAALPTKAELDHAVKKGLIGKDTYQSVLKQMRYNDDWISVFTLEAFPPADLVAAGITLPLLP